MNGKSGLPAPGSLRALFSLLDAQTRFLDWNSCCGYPLIRQARRHSKVRDRGGVLIQQQLHGQLVNLVGVTRYFLRQIRSKTTNPLERHAAETKVRRIGTSAGGRVQGCRLRICEDLLESLQTPG